MKKKINIFFKYEAIKYKIPLLPASIEYLEQTFKADNCKKK